MRHVLNISKTNGQAKVWSRHLTFKAKPVYAGRLASILVTGIVTIFYAVAAEPVPEIQSKAKFLINFAEFTDWPEGVFAENNKVFKIGVLGRDPFGKELDKLAESELLKGRHARVLRSRKVEELKLCHILYIGQSEGSRLDRILRTLNEKPVLTVSEIENSANRGVMIQMKTEKEKVRLVINLDSAKAANLTLKSKLLRLGEIVEPAKK